MMKVQPLMNARIDYHHRQSAHCENGVTSGILSYHGLDVSEAMVFGIGSGLFFAYAPFLKMGSLPLTTYRSFPGAIFKKFTARVGIRIVSQTFRSQDAGREALDEMLSQGVPVCCQVGIYWLPYFPEGMRFHFNAHNVVVYGKQGRDYLISDPVLDEPVTCPEAALMESRWAKGPMAPKGRLYYPVDIPDQVDLRSAVLKGIRETCFVMRAIPFLCFGVHGMRLLARRLAHWPERLGERQASRCLGNVIRMQEEIGTGGAGFRFIYAAFLQEVGDLFADRRFYDLADRLTRTGDQWRQFACMAARNCKRRATREESYVRLSELLHTCADQEDAVFAELGRLAKSIKL